MSAAPTISRVVISRYFPGVLLKKDRRLRITSTTREAEITFGRSKKREGCNPSEFGINPLLSMAVLDSTDSVLPGESHERSRHGSFPRYRAFCSSAFMMSRNVLGFSPQSDVMELPQEALR